MGSGMVPLIMKYEGGTNKDWGMGWDDFDNIFFAYESGGNNWDTNKLYGTTTLVSGVWYHATFTYDNTAKLVRLYLDGIEENSTTLPNYNTRYSR